MNKKKWILVISFILLQFLVLYGLSVVAIRNLWSRGYDNHRYFYELEEDSVEVIFVGPSTSYCTFSPTQLYEEYGISSYNFGTSNQSALASLLWTMEADETQNIKVVVIEAFAITISHGNIGNDIRSLSSMGITKNFLRLALTYKRNAINILFPVVALHDDWTISGDTFSYSYDETAPYLRGYRRIFSVAGEGYTESILTGDETATEYVNFTYLDRLREYCEAHGIALIIVKSLMASNEASNWNDGLHNVIAAYAKQYDIAFLDFNTEEMIEDIGFVLAEDVAEDLRHMNIYGAAKATSYIGAYLLEQTDVEFTLYGDDSIDEEVIATYHTLLENE